MSKRYSLTNNTIRLAILILIILTETGGNLLLNGNFADWETPVKPTGWIVEDTTKARINRSEEQVRSAPFSCKITRMVTGTGNNYGLRQYVNVTPGTIYTFSAWFYDDDINARGGLLITWCRNDSTAIRSTPVVYTDSSIHTWQKLVRTDTAPDSAVYAKCLLRIYGFTGGPAGGVVFVDDAEMIQGPGWIAETNIPILGNDQLRAIRVASDKKVIRLTVAAACNVKLTIFDLNGSRHLPLYSGRIDAGTHNFHLHPNSRLRRGVYFVVARLSNSQTLTEKLVIDK